MSDWLEHSAQIEIEAPIDLVWSLWSDLEQMPNWTKWIKSVTISPDDPNISIWKLSAGSWEFNWKSRLIKVIPQQIIQWESVDGLPNRGAIRFYNRQTSCIVKMSISYSVPNKMAKIMDNFLIGWLVESTIKSDLEKFRKYAVTLNPIPK